MKETMKALCITVLLACLVAQIGCSGGKGHDETSHSEHEQTGSEHAAEVGHEEGIVTLAPEAAALTNIKLARAEQRAISPVLHTTARVAFDERKLAHVSPRIAGRVLRVHHELGDDVVAGEVLAVLDSIDLGQAKADYLTARAEEDLASKTLAREESLYKDKISSEQSVLESRTVHEKALARLRAAGEKLRLLGIRDEQIETIRYGDPEASLFSVEAPLQGRVVAKHLAIGELVSPTDKIFTVADLDHLWIWIDVFERNLSRVHSGDEAVVVTQAYPGRLFRGLVTYVRDQVDTDTRTARARIDIDNPDRALKPGMFAKVTLTDVHNRGGKASGRGATTTVPASAVIRDGDGWVAFVKEGERRYQRREVRLGVRTEHFVEILEGVKPGETVVSKGIFVLKSEIAKAEMVSGHGH